MDKAILLSFCAELKKRNTVNCCLKQLFVSFDNETHQIQNQLTSARVEVTACGPQYTTHCMCGSYNSFGSSGRRKLVTGQNSSTGDDKFAKMSHKTSFLRWARRRRSFFRHYVSPTLWVSFSLMVESPLLQ